MTRECYRHVGRKNQEDSAIVGPYTSKMIWFKVPVTAAKTAWPSDKCGHSGEPPLSQGRASLGGCRKGRSSGGAKRRPGKQDKRQGQQTLQGGRITCEWGGEPGRLSPSGVAHMLCLSPSLPPCVRTDQGKGPQGPQNPAHQALHTQSSEIQSSFHV